MDYFDMPKKFTQEQVEQYFLDHGCKLIGEYKNANIKTRFICECGNEYAMRFNNFNRGMRCYYCGLKKHHKAISGSGNGKYRHDRDIYTEETLFFRKSYYYLTECRKHKNKIRQLDIDRLGYSGIELFYRLTTHPNWLNCRFKNPKWHIDHIFPIRAFYEYGITDLKIINSLDNLQPLTNSKNASKGKNFDPEKFKQYLDSKGIKYEPLY